MNKMRPFISEKVRADGFTLVELLVVIATVGVLTMMLLPALASTHPNSQAFQCLENLRQLTMGWQMYAEDNTGKLARNGSQVNTPITPTDPNLLPGGIDYQWCPGNMSAVSPYATNYVQDGCLYQYVNTMSIYKCPADQSGIKFGPYFYPRIRSYSMNCWLSPITPWSSPTLRIFYKDTDIIHPKPAMTFVFIGENEISINDGFFVSDPSRVNWWQDIPETRHGSAGGLSYADGHSEMKGWTDKYVLHPTTSSGFTSDPNSGDNAWLEQRATSFIE